MDFRIRPAGEADAPFLAWVILTAGRANLRRCPWEIMIDGTEQETLRLLESVVGTRTPHPYHHSSFLVAETNGQPAGALGGYDVEQTGDDALKRAFPEIGRKLGWTRDDYGAAIRRMKPINSCVPADIAGAWGFESFAILPGIRGRGIAAALINGTLDRGREGGFRKAQASSYIGHRGAQRMYERVGFRPVVEKRHPEFERVMGSPGIILFAMDL